MKAFIRGISRAARLAVLAAIALPATSIAQDETPDWADVVVKAQEHRRFAIRRAAANKLAGGGAAAIDAVRDWLESRDRNELSLFVVDAFARSGDDGDAVVGFLADLARDTDFYWRSQALAGLATRGLPAFEPLYRAGVDDPSHLYRRESVGGLLMLDPGLGDQLPTGEGRAIPDDPRHPLAIAARLVHDDPDPRARAAIALFLLRAGSWAGLPELVALVDHADVAWLDDPWASRLAVDALRLLRSMGGPDFQAAIAGEGDARAAARTAFRAWAVERFDDPAPYAAADRRAARGTRLADARGGLDFRSCRNGDLFVSWTPDGLVRLGLQPDAELQLPAAAWAPLLAEIPDLAGSAVHGRVVCDYARLLARPSAEIEAHHKAAPQALPDGITAWIEAFAAALRAHGGTGFAAAIDARLPQFRAAAGGR